MTDRVTRLAALSREQDLIAPSIPVEYDGLDLALPEPMFNAKRIAEGKLPANRLPLCGRIWQAVFFPCQIHGQPGQGAGDQMTKLGKQTRNISSPLRLTLLICLTDRREKAATLIKRQGLCLHGKRVRRQRRQNISEIMRQGRTFSADQIRKTSITQLITADAVQRATKQIASPRAKLDGKRNTVDRAKEHGAAKTTTYGAQERVTKAVGCAKE